DTTLVFFVGIFDLLKTIEVARVDPKWATPVTSASGYAFAAVFYFVFCFLMARYADRIEYRLARADRRGGQRRWVSPSAACQPAPGQAAAFRWEIPAPSNGSAISTPLPAFTWKFATADGRGSSGRP